MNVYTSAQAMVGKTPMLRLSAIEKEYNLEGMLLAKLEACNPAGSAKDRVALNMILDAEEKGLLTHGATIIEPTSGKTGIGLALVGSLRGYRAIIVMPDSMSVERQKLMKAYGAEVVLTPGALGMQGSLDKAAELQASIPGSIQAGQFVNPVNPAAHYATTGPEIMADTEGQVDILVAGVGTGGTLSGTGRYLKERLPHLRVVAVEPAASPLLSGGKAGPHAIQGIGANFIPATLDRGVYDEVIPVDNEVPVTTAKELAATEGILVGISSGAALWAATQLAQRAENVGKTIVVILPDSADRYFSTPLFA